jgi:hypothetical protein
MRGRTYGGMPLEDALARLSKWAARVTADAHLREEELVARRNTEALREVGIVIS